MPPAAEPLGPPTSALNVARYLVLLAASEKDGPAQEPDFLTHMRLQKLLYYVQGWSLGLTGQPMFNDPIQAWKWGPVVPTVYQSFKQHGAGPIPASEGNFEGLSDGQKALIRRCWETYKPFGPMALVEMTHKEAPWLAARGGLPESANCETEITREAIRAAFAERAQSENGG